MKIFCIGLSRTGATALNEALITLGYRSHFVVYGEEDLRGELAEFDAFTHMPIAARFKELDKRFPDSKFILNVRNDRDGWLNSCEKRMEMGVNISEAGKRVLERTYGTVAFDRDMYSAAYDRHVDSVMEHFKDREEDLLVIDVTRGEGFEKLCPFLGKPVLDQPLQVLNTMSDLQKPSRRLRRFLSRLVRASNVKRILDRLAGR